MIINLIKKFINKSNISFVSDHERMFALRQVRSHNTMAFNEARRVLEKKEQEIQEQEWINKFSSLEDYTPMIMISYSKCLAYVYKHFGLAQLARDGIFGVKVVYLKEKQ